MYTSFLQHCDYPVSSIFRASSVIFLASELAFSTIFSILLCALFRWSGPEVFAKPIALSFFWCTPRAIRMTPAASVPALRTCETVCFRLSAVGGGIWMVNSSGEEGESCGLSEREDDKIDEEIGFTCCH